MVEIGVVVHEVYAIPFQHMRVGLGYMELPYIDYFLGGAFSPGKQVSVDYAREAHLTLGVTL